MTTAKGHPSQQSNLRGSPYLRGAASLDCFAPLAMTCTADGSSASDEIFENRFFKRKKGSSYKW
jgi:hypothetical protein